MGSRTGGIGSVEVVYCVLTIVEEVEGFPRGVMTFPVHVILEKSGGVPAIKLGVQDAVHIPRTFAILGDHGFTRGLNLAGQGVGSHMAQEVDMEDGMHLHGLGEL